METEPLAFRVVRGGLFVAASSYFNIGFGFLANLLLTRLLAPEAFGTFALAVFFFHIAQSAVQDWGSSQSELAEGWTQEYWKGLR